RSPRAKRLWTTLPLAEMSPILTKLPVISSSREYQGEQWVGRSHRSDEHGVVQHSLRWIAEEARRHELMTQLMPYPIVNDQYWLRVTRGDGSR
ncbi:MAG TPA: hypothetical protein VES97_04040, partial [Solirubrobacteraceae bacterium]|nr:hypothetical protein [Solirubrobacteraceae bacterium]